MTLPRSRGFLDRALAFLALALLAIAFPAAGQAQNVASLAGTSGAEFLKLGVGGAAGGMAEAQIGMADDAYAAYYNPAGLTWTTRPTFAALDDQYFQSITYGFLGFSYPFGVEDGWSHHVVSLDVYNLSADNIDRRTDDTDAAINQFGVSETAYAVSYAYRPCECFGVGATAKLIVDRLDDVQTEAEAIDLGAQYRLIDSHPLDLGVSLRNIGTELHYAQGSDPLPFTAGVGLAAREWIPRTTVDVDVLESRDTNPYFAVGAEYRVPMGKNWSAALRAGYTSHYSDTTDIPGYTLGGGLRLGRLSLDVAWVPFGDLGNTFKYSLEIRF